MNENYRLITEAGYSVSYRYAPLCSDFIPLLAAVKWDGFVAKGNGEHAIRSEIEWYLNNSVEVESHTLRFKKNQTIDEKLSNAKHGSKLDIMLAKIANRCPSVKAIKEAQELAEAIQPTIIKAPKTQRGRL